MQLTWLTTGSNFLAKKISFFLLNFNLSMSSSKKSFGLHPHQSQQLLYAKNKRRYVDKVNKIS